MRRRSSSISDNVPYPKPTMYLRVAQMILCLVCLILAIFFWTSGHMFVGATVVLFATSFGFLVVTVIDVVASLKRKHYTAPVWVGLAFLAAFMCFLSFGFMLFQSVLFNMMIGVVFAITGVVFLVDGVILIVRAFESNLLRKVHPISEEKPDKQTFDQPVQVEDDLEIIEELPVETRRIAPVGAGKRRSSFPITSYGGTFPVGGSDAPPLPTPDNLTGIEPAVPANLYVPKRNTLDNSPRTHSISSDVSSNKRTSIDETKNLYPSAGDGNQGEGSLRSQHNGSRVLSEQSRQVNLTNYSSAPTVDPSNEEPAEDAVIHIKRSYPPHHTTPLQPQQPSLNQEEEVSPRIYLTPYQAAGDQRPNFEVHQLPFDPRYQLDSVPCQVQTCQCCASRVYDPTEQITPYVTHHYSQSPCTCGYTHYRASTVVKGAVKQYPQNSVQQQQRIIEEQLEQMRDNRMHHGCSCHDKTRQGQNVGYTAPAALDIERHEALTLLSEHNEPNLEQPTDISTSLDYGVMNQEFGSVNEGDSNESVFKRESFFDEGDDSTSKPLSLRNTRNRNLSDQDKSMNRKVTIGTLDIISPSYSDVSNESQYRRWAESVETDHVSKNTRKTIVSQVYAPNILRRTSLDSHGGYGQQKPTLDTIGEDLQEPPNTGRYVRSLSEALDVVDRRKISQPAQENIVQTEEHETIHTNTNLDRLGNKRINDSYVLIRNSRSTEVQDAASQAISINGRSLHLDEQPIRKYSNNESVQTVQTNVSENLSCPCQPGSELSFVLDESNTWSSEAREAEKSAEIAPPVERNPKTYCSGIPPKCLCCPMLKSEVLRSSVNFVTKDDDRRASIVSHVLPSHRRSGDEGSYRSTQGKEWDNDEMRSSRRSSLDNRSILSKDNRNRTRATLDNDDIRSHKRMSLDSRSTPPKDNKNQTREVLNNDEIRSHRGRSLDSRTIQSTDNRNQTRVPSGVYETRNPRRVSLDSSTPSKDDRNRTAAPLDNEEIRSNRRLSLDSKTQSANYNDRNALDNQSRSTRRSSLNSRNIPLNYDMNSLENQIEQVLNEDEIKSQRRYSLQSGPPNYDRNTLENQMEGTLNNDDTRSQRSVNSRNISLNYKRNTLEDQIEESKNTDEIKSQRGLSLNSRNMSLNNHRNMQDNYSGLPRMLDPIQEQRIREDIHLSDSEEKISHIPPYFDGFPKEPCVCDCICNPRCGPRDMKEAQEAPATNKYTAVPLNQQPYHPKDDFRMMPNPFTNFDHKSSRLEDAIGPSKRYSSKGENSQKRYQEDEDRYRRSTQRSTALRDSVHRRTDFDQSPDFAMRMDAQDRECLEQCPSCPVRRRKMQREAKLMEEMNYRNTSSISKRGPLKRSYPDERK
ncbi:uncharacterized protein LOC123681759 isoform X2 [Harmonia axyridis]|uniref:uncharacterized protein LOC123681759 isoform X2 n=1 Tax=Harmonia axyridis TaxID=115357 RepID=UPI001E27784C|nr:uncharacterized protein LOC123681759 isoform X2 [Harmonia axyridis]